jgi:hypothetical protein
MLQAKYDAAIPTEALLPPILITFDTAYSSPFYNCQNVKILYFLMCHGCHRQTHITHTAGYYDHEIKKNKMGEICGTQWSEAEC